MTYNGVGMTSTKGSGLSGYIQRSRVAVRRSNIQEQAGDDEIDTKGKPTALEKSRSKQENDDLAAALLDHDRLRAIKLEVVEYREGRLAEGVPSDQVERESNELKATRLRHYNEEKQAAIEKMAPKSAERFAEAFGVRGDKSTHVAGDAFDRDRHQRAKAAAQQERSKVLEEKIEERLKKARID